MHRVWGYVGPFIVFVISVIFVVVLTEGKKNIFKYKPKIKQEKDCSNE